MSSLSQQPARVPIGKTADGKDVFITLPWQKWAMQVDVRLGGQSGLSNAEILTLISRTAASEMIMQPAQAGAQIEAFMQPSPPQQSIDELMQPAECGFFYDPIFQG